MQSSSLRPALLALTLLPLGALSCADSAGTTKAMPVGASIAFDDPIVDLGKVWDVDVLECSFAFKNIGGKRLQIGEIKPSCGCTTTELDRTSFEPGEGSSIDVVWKPLGFGNQAKTLMVHSNSEGEGLEMLTVRAQIQPFAGFTQNPMRMGILEEGVEHRQVVSLDCVDRDFEVLEITSANRFLKANDLGRQSDRTHGIELVFVGETPWGQQTCSVQVKVRGRIEGRQEPIEHTAVLNVTASVFGRLRVEPTMYAVGHVLPTHSFERSVRLKHVNGYPFTVTKAEVLNSTPPGMEVIIEPYKIGIDEGVMLNVKGQAADYLGLIRATVRFHTDIPGEKPRTVPVMGIVRE